MRIHPALLGVVMLAAAAAAACGSRAAYVREAVMTEGAPMVVLQLPGELRIGEQEMGASGMGAYRTIGDTMEEPAEDWSGVYRVVHEGFRDAIGADRVTLLSPAESRRLMEEHSAARAPYTGWAAYDGAVAVVTTVEGGFTRREWTGDEWVYRPHLGAVIDFWRVDADAPGALLVYGSTVAAVDFEEFRAGELTLEEALESVDVRTHRDALRDATREVVAEFVAEMQAED